MGVVFCEASRSENAESLRRRKGISRASEVSSADVPYSAPLPQNTH